MKNYLAGFLLGFFFFFLGVFWFMDTEFARDLPTELKNPRLALSFLQSPEEFYAILGNPEEEEFLENINTLQRSFTLERNFLIFGLGFWGFLCFYTSRRHWKEVRFYLWMGFSVLCLLGFWGLGIAEMDQLEQILRSKSEERRVAHMEGLYTSSHLRWALFFLLAQGMGFWLWIEEKGLLLKASAFFLSSGASFYLFSFWKFRLLEAGISSVVFGFFLYWLYFVLQFFLFKKT